MIQPGINTHYWMPPIPAVPPPATLMATAAPPASLTGPDRIQTGRLLNGATGHFVQMPNQQQSVLHILLPLNTIPPGTEYLLMDLLEEGSEATKQMLSQLRDRGIRMSTGRLDGKLTLRVIGQAGQEGLMAQAALGLLTNPVVDPVNFRSLQAKMYSNYQGKLSNPDIQLANAMDKRIYGPGHMFCLTPDERMAIIARQTLPELLGRFRQALQQPGAAQMMMISSQPAAVQQQLTDAAIQSAGWFPNPYAVNGAQFPDFPLPNPASGIQTVLVPNETLKRALIRETWRVPDARDPDYPAFLLLRQLLQSTSAGSFFQTLRTDHGLVYSIGQSEGSRLANGMRHNITLEVDFDKIGAALADVRQVTQNLGVNQVSPAFLETLKRKAMLSLRDLMQMPQGADALYSSWLQLGATPMSMPQLQAALNRVTPEDLRRVANKVFNPADGYQVVGISAPSAVLQMPQVQQACAQLRQPFPPPAPLRNRL